MYTYPQHDPLSNLILNVFGIMVLLVFIWVIYAIVYAIFMFIFSWGNEEKIKKAWNSIRYAVLGFILTLIILFAVPWVLKTLKVPGYKYYTTENIFKNAKFWLNRVVEVFSQNKKNDITPTSNYEL